MHTHELEGCHWLAKKAACSEPSSETQAVARTPAQRAFTDHATTLSALGCGLFPMVPMAHPHFVCGQRFVAHMLREQGREVLCPQDFVHARGAASHGNLQSKYRAYAVLVRMRIPKCCLFGPPSGLGGRARTSTTRRGRHIALRLPRSRCAPGVRAEGVWLVARRDGRMVGCRADRAGCAPVATAAVGWWAGECRPVGRLRRVANRESGELAEVNHCGAALAGPVREGSAARRAGRVCDSNSD